MKVNLIPRKNLAILSAAFCTVMFAFSYNASAVPHALPPVITASNAVTGDITLFGTATINGNANTATMVTAYHGIGGTGSPFVATADGSFTGLDGGAVTFAAPRSFNSGPVSNFWSVGGFVFNLIASSITVQAGGSLVVDGTGTITGNGFDATAASWHFTTQNPSAKGVFSFSAATGAGAVPDGGSTVALLGIGLGVIEFIRRKLRLRS
jgi:protein with PEP-CTERM/exosortase system signal